MAVTAQAYLTGFGRYLSGDPVDNDGIVARLGGEDRVTERIRRQVLASNGITQRHYALDEHGEPTELNEQLSIALKLEEYRRAVHSMRFDDSFLEILAIITDDPTFRDWKIGGLSIWMDSNVDVPRMVYRHALLCEYAHARLVKLAHGHYPRDTVQEFD